MWNIVYEKKVKCIGEKGDNKNKRGEQITTCELNIQIYIIL